MVSARSRPTWSCGSATGSAPAQSFGSIFKVRLAREEIGDRVEKLPNLTERKRIMSRRALARWLPRVPRLGTRRPGIRISHRGDNPDSGIGHQSTCSKKIVDERCAIRQRSQLGRGLRLYINLVSDENGGVPRPHQKKSGICRRKRVANPRDHSSCEFKARSPLCKLIVDIGQQLAYIAL
jgi:hypothetical protein